MVESVINPVTMTERESCQLRGEEVEIFSIPKVRVFVRFFTGGNFFFTGIFQIQLFNGQRRCRESGVGSPKKSGKLKPRNSKKHELLGQSKPGNTTFVGLKFEHFEFYFFHFIFQILYDLSLLSDRSTLQ